MNLNTIQFPKMGIEFDLNPVAFSIGPFSVHWYGIAFALAFAAGILLALRHCGKYGFKQDDIIDLVLFAAPISIVCARSFYVLFNLQYYMKQPHEIYKVWHGGLALYGSLIGALGTAIVFSRIKKINIMSFLDFTIPYFVLGQFIGRWGNFANQEAFGVNTNLPWGMTGGTIEQTIRIENIPGVVAGIPVHPTFLYESLWNLGVFIILMLHRKNKRINGEIICLYMMLYGLGRAWVEPLRTDSLMLGSLRINMVLAMIFFVVFTFLFFRLRSKGNHEVYAEEPTDTAYSEILKKLRDEDVQESGQNIQAVTNEEPDSIDAEGYSQADGDSEAEGIHSIDAEGMSEESNGEEQGSNEESSNDDEGSKNNQ